MIHRAYATAMMVLVMMIIMAPREARADCTAPVAAAGDVIYNSTDKIFQYCNDTDWVAMNIPGAGSGGCTVPATAEGAMFYNADDRVMQGCAGNVYRAMGPVGGSSQTEWLEVSTGGAHTCAVKKNGTLWCWGIDVQGQLGNGAVGSQITPIQESTAATDWASVSAGEYHSCAIKIDGRLFCWGDEAFGALGNGSGFGNQQSPDQESTGATDWALVSAGNRTTCATKTDGRLFCWGNDNNGQLGNGAPFSSLSSPSQESTGATDWAQVSTSNGISCAVKTDGRLFCWGSDGTGGLGNGAITGNQASPVQESTAATNWTMVGTGTGFSCAVKTDGRLFCWGNDADGQLGNGAPAGNQISPVQESTAATDWASLNLGYANACAVKTDGRLFCWGDDDYSQLGNGLATGDQISPVQESTGATDWASADVQTQHGCGLKTDGRLFCWGGEGFGELGDGSTTGHQPSAVQESTAAIDWASVSAGISHSCALKIDGRLFCWGDDQSGQLGNGAAAGVQLIPVQESTAAANWASVSAGFYYTCAIKTDGRLYCWGGDTNGRLGNGAPTIDQVSPVQESTAATNWASVAAGNGHTCAVKTNGTLFCWGSDASGQLGNGATTGNQVSPVQESTAATNWVSVTVGNLHTCAVKTNGTLFCWGSDTSGQLGNGATAGNQISPVQESTTATDWMAVTATNGSTCALKTDGRIFCWGTDSNGELGNGVTAGNQISPVQESTSATDWSSLRAGGGQHVCALKTDKHISCWGSDSAGQLGNGAITGTQISPVDIGPLWDSVAAGGAHTCAIAQQKIYCWGGNGSGQLGARGNNGGPRSSDVCQTINGRDYPSGAIILNSDDNVLQYCDGSGWVRMGI